MAAVDNTSLERWRGLDAAAVLVALAEYAKPDPTFMPTRDPRTTRWHATVRGHDFELLLTGTKFWDARAELGGGGAIDLAMHLAGLKFTQAIQVLREAGL